MSRNPGNAQPGNAQPGRLYVFVVLSLAAFLCLFMMFRDRSQIFETSVVFRPVSMNGGEVAADQLEVARSDAQIRLVTPEFILDSLQDAGVVSGDATPELLEISGEIASRMRMRATTSGKNVFLELSLITERPAAGIRLLDSMMARCESMAGDTDSPAVIQASPAGIQASPAGIRASPAAVSQQQARAITRDNLAKISLASLACGWMGLLLRRRSLSGSRLVTKVDVADTAGVPVVGDFVERFQLPERDRVMVRRRTLRAGLHFAELVVAAVFLLMMFQLATREALLSQFVDNPLAAYSEVLTRVMG